MRLIKNDTMWNEPFAGMDYFFNRSLGSPLDLWFENLHGSANRSFRVDKLEDNENLYVVAEMPGYDKKDVSVELENAVLTISANRKTGKKANAENLSVSRSITVGDEANADKVTATLENGLLTVTLPKAEQRKPKAIAIK